MAEEQKKTEPPALLSYGEEANGKNLTDFFSHCLLRSHRIGGLIYTAKDKGQAGRLCKEFKYEELQQMVKHWMKTSSIPHSFNAFYSTRYDLNKAIQPKDYEWD